jgi:DHA2 family multidrug resistance protein
MNSATGLINLARNIGGSVGISLVTTLEARLAQRHQTNLVVHLSPLNPRDALHGITGALTAHGASAATAAHQAQALFTTNSCANPPCLLSLMFSGFWASCAWS